jgi:DNA/RNA-binding domain of Phe-tRNA-synthetase-like protein
MKYSVQPYVFEKNPNILFGVIVGRDLVNSITTTEDSTQLTQAEVELRSSILPSDLKTHVSYKLYRDALLAFDINPNRYMNSIEAMSKRILKGQSLPRINAVVDLCNAIGLKHRISLGGHDLADIHKDLEVRLSTLDDIFLPFGQSGIENMPENELVFISGNEVQTRYWLWRQSELGKMRVESKDVFFQLVGFKENEQALDLAMNELQSLIETRFKGTFKRFRVDCSNKSIEF